MQEALKLEKEVNQSLLDIHKIASARIDPQVIAQIIIKFLIII